MKKVKEVKREREGGRKEGKQEEDERNTEATDEYKAT